MHRCSTQFRYIICENSFFEHKGNNVEMNLLQNEQENEVPFPDFFFFGVQSEILLHLCKRLRIQPASLLAYLVAGSEAHRD